MLPEVPTYFTGAVLGLWLLLYLLGRKQLDRLKSNTKQLALDGIEAALEKNNDLTIQQYYEKLNGQWEQMVPQTTKFIPHKSELFPVPAKLETVRKQLNYSPEWLGAFLKLNGHTLKATAAQQERIEYILSLGDHLDR